MERVSITPRQRDVLDALIAGTGTTLDIAARLGMAEGTVSVHLGAVMRKLGFTTRTQLAVWWTRERFA